MLKQPNTSGSHTRAAASKSTASGAQSRGRCHALHECCCNPRCCRCNSSSAVSRAVTTPTTTAIQHECTQRFSGLAAKSFVRNPRARSCPHSAQRTKAGKQPGANGGNIRAAASQRPASCAQSGGLQLQVAPSGGYRELRQMK